MKNETNIDKIAKKALIETFRLHVKAAWNGREKPHWDVAGNTFGLENEPIVGPAVMVRGPGGKVIHALLNQGIMGNGRLLSAIGEKSYRYRLKCPLFEKVVKRDFMVER
jgi:hypothetical protein